MIINYITNKGNRKIFSLIVYITISAFALTTCGCYTTEVAKINANNLAEQSDYHIISATMKNGIVVNLNDKGAVFAPNYQDKENVIVYRTAETIKNKSGQDELTSKTNTINLDDISYLTVEKEVMSAGGTTVAIVLALAGISVIIAIAVAASSCPFIFSFNGEKYIFDAEPYGGSVSEGLKKTDYSRLEELKASDGKYKLLLMNVTDETQYTDEIKLLVIEHSLNTEVAPDITGKFTVFEKAVTPLSVTEENGKDITVFFKSKDNIQWQTDMNEKTNNVSKNLKHEVILKFPKPADAKKAKLLINTGTAQWGEFMIKQMLEYRGNKVDNWYEDIDKKGKELMKLYQFVEREELFIMKANVFENNKWVARGTVSAGGPYIDEDRIVELNLENVTGDTLYIKLNPPYGYWKFDYAGVIYESNETAEITELSPVSALNEKGMDLRNTLLTVDGQYYSMPDTTCSAKLEFEVPAEKINIKRSLYLKTTGYYEIHLKKDKPEQTELIERIYNTPGLILELSLKEYTDRINTFGYSGK
jgi:hypothetical protein